MALIDAPTPHIAPTVEGAVSRRLWVQDALCAQPPHDKMVWVIGASMGHEQPSSVVARFDVCNRCPVRSECLNDAVSERAFTVMGVFGGTTMTERTATVHRIRKTNPEGSEDDIRNAAARSLAESFSTRHEMWRRRAQGRTPLVGLPSMNPSCRTCGQGFLIGLPALTCAARYRTADGVRTCRQIAQAQAEEMAA